MLATFLVSDKFHNKCLVLIERNIMHHATKQNSNRGNKNNFQASLLFYTIISCPAANLVQTTAQHCHIQSQYSTQIFLILLYIMFQEQVLNLIQSLHSSYQI